MKEFISKLFVGVTLVILQGCGTFNNLVPTTPCADGHGGGPANIVYGGTRSSFSDGSRCLLRPQEPQEVLAGVAIIAIDVPLCIVADTLTLPMTVQAHHERNQVEQDKHHSKQSDDF
ncbi:MAG TPA: YceK/YidQ family lipoprotein [Planctomicrobium sp.]|nr:YceK/YidQ family lipoprotein [Planctomicrobium sp.]